MAGFYFIFLQIFLSVGMLKFSFMDVFKATAHYNGIDELGNQEVQSLTETSAMLDVLSSAGYGILGVLLVGALGMSAILAVLSLFLGEVKVVKIGGRVFFAVSLVLFVICFLLCAKTGSHF